MAEFKSFGSVHGQQVDRIHTAIHFDQWKIDAIVFHEIQVKDQLLKGQIRLAAVFFFYKIKKCGQVIQDFSFLRMLHGKLQQAGFQEIYFPTGTEAFCWRPR